ncbi:hypothetical protein Drorol1_Dr00004801 [Drosera rotundifolia]
MITPKHIHHLVLNPKSNPTSNPLHGPTAQLNTSPWTPNIIYLPPKKVPAQLHATRGKHVASPAPPRATFHAPPTQKPQTLKITVNKNYVSFNKTPKHISKSEINHRKSKPTKRLVMMNAVAIGLILTTVSFAGLLSPPPATKPEPEPEPESVIVKGGHRAVIVEYADSSGGGNTRISISPPSATAPSKSMILAATDAVAGAAGEVKGKMSDMMSSNGPHVASPRELICDAVGKCKHKIAAAMTRAKEKVAETVEEAKEAVVGGGEDAREGSEADVEQAKKKGEDAADELSSAREKAAERAKEAGDAAERVKEMAKEKAKEVFVEMPKRKAEDVADELSSARDKASEKAKEAAEKLSEKMKEKANEVFVEMPKRKGEEMVEEVAGKAWDVEEKVEAAAGMVREKLRKGERVRDLSDIARRAKEVLCDSVSYVVSRETVDAMMQGIQLFGVAVGYGISVWVTFVMSHVLAGVLPRQQFAIVQSKLYPVYFKAMGFSVGSALLGHLMVQRRRGITEKQEMLQVYGLGGLFLSVLVNYLFLEPRATKVMFDKMKIEKEEGRGRESMTQPIRGREPRGVSDGADAQPATPVAAREHQEPEAKLEKLNERLKKLNMYSSLLNLATLMGLSWHLMYLSQRLQVANR